MSRRYFKYDDLGNIIQMFESSMQEPPGTDWEEVTQRYDLAPVLRRTNMYRKNEKNEFVLKPVATVQASKPEFIADGVDSIEVWVDCPEYPEEIFSLDIGDRCVDVVHQEKIEISTSDPGVMIFNIKSKYVRPVAAHINARQA